MSSVSAGRPISGASFSPFVKVDDVIPVGDGFALQGGFARPLSFPAWPWIDPDSH